MLEIPDFFFIVVRTVDAGHARIQEFSSGGGGGGVSGQSGKKKL